MPARQYDYGKFEKLYMNGSSHKEIASEIGCALSTVNTIQKKLGIVRLSKGKNRGPGKCEACGLKERAFLKTYGIYDKYCFTCRRHAYSRAVDDHCHACGFIPIDGCQLDVDHKDENHDNNDPSNLGTLCSNCHELKTHRIDVFNKHYPTYLNTG